MNKSESKYFNTALCMDDALIALLEVKDLEYITVKEICEKAGVNRSTFYLHYETVDDLLNEAIESVNRRFLDYFPRSTDHFADEIDTRKLDDLVLVTRDYLKPYLQYIQENRKVYRAFLRNPDAMQASVRYNFLKQYILEPILKKFGVPKPHWKYYIAYYIEGIFAIVKEWLRNDCRESVEAVSLIIEECVRPPAGTDVKPYEK